MNRTPQMIDLTRSMPDLHASLSPSSEDGGWFSGVAFKGFILSSPPVSLDALWLTCATKRISVQTRK